MSKTIRKPAALLLAVLLAFYACGTAAYCHAGVGSRPAGNAEAPADPAEGPSASAGEETATATDPGAREEEPPACEETGAHLPEGYSFLDEGRHSFQCALCGETVTEDCAYAAEPAFTPDGNGSHYDSCLLCGGRRTEPCRYTEETVPPTEYEAGYTRFTCDICGYRYEDNETPAECERAESQRMGDADGNGKVDSADARTILRASVRLEQIPADRLPYSDPDADGAITSADARLTLRTGVKLEKEARHDYGIAIVTAQTCTASGELTCRCGYCGESRSVKIPASGHRYECTFSSDATCTEGGKKVYTCKVCRDAKTEESPAKGHQWTEATLTAPKRCSACGEMITGWTQVGQTTVYFGLDGKAPAGKTVAYLDYQGEAAYWYLNNGVLDRTVRDGVTVNGADWIVTEGKARRALSASDKTLFRAFAAVRKATTPDMTKEQKLRACFNYVKKAYEECSPRSPHYLGADWPILYANDMFVNGQGNCFSYAAAFGFMAKAIGYEEVYGCNSTGHGWTEIDGKVYDPEWSKGNTNSTFFGISYYDNVGVNYKVILPMIGHYAYAHVKI